MKKQFISAFGSVLLLLLIQLQTHAQYAVSTSQKFKRLVEFFGEHHLRPIEINDEFGERVFSNFIAAVDPEKVLFNKTEYEALKAASISIDEEARSGSIVYLKLFERTFQDAVNRSEELVSSILKQSMDLTKTRDFDRKIYSDYPSAENHAQLWEMAIRSQLLKEVSRLLKTDNYAIPEGNSETIIDSAQQIVRNKYTEFFKSLKSEDYNLAGIYLNAVAEAFDPHSSYFTKEQRSFFEQELQSEREIFGFTINKNNRGKFEVGQIIPGSSAWLSGEVHSGDEILALKFGDGNWIMLSDLTQLEVNRHFMNNASDMLELEINDAVLGSKIITLHRGKVYSDEDIIKSAVLEGTEKIGYISLPDFYTSWTDTTALGCANDVAKALVKLKRENISGLILDLRDNGGGSLGEAIDLVGIFIDFGPVIICKDYEGDVWSLKDFNRGAIFRAPLIVLINEYSASASEVVAGALQDYNRALIVGRNSFGKATGQTILPLDPGKTAHENDAWGFAKITDVGIYRIDHSTNQNVGVKPDVILEPVYNENPFRESSYPYTIAFDGIDKKVYYTPEKRLPVEALSDKSSKRRYDDELFQKLKNLHQHLDSLTNDMDLFNLSLKDYLAIKQKQAILIDQIDDTYGQVVSNYSAKSLSFDEEIYTISEYMDTYRKAFIESVNADHELSEAYSIIIDLLHE